MLTRATATLAALLAAGLLLSACSGNSADADSKPSPKPTVAVTTAGPTPDGPSKECVDDVYQLLLDAMNDKGTPEMRPDACAGLTDAEWHKVVDEQSQKVFEVGKSAIEGGADGVQACVDAVAARAPGPDGSVPFEPAPAPCAGLSDDEYLDAYWDGIAQGNQAGRDELQKRSDEAAREDAS